MNRRFLSQPLSLAPGEPSFAAPVPVTVLLLALLWFSPFTAVGQAPTVSVNGPLQITSSNAIIAATINPNGSFTSFYVQWGLTAAYGQVGPVGVLPIPNIETNTSAWMIGLSPSTTYHYRLVAANSAGTNYSGGLTLTTADGPPPPNPVAPTATTGGASAITASSASLNGTVGKDFFATAAYYFRWGTSDAYGNTTTPGLLSDEQTSGTFAVSGGLAGLTPGTTYHYQLVATNSAGVATGADQTFTTLGLVSIGGHDFSYAVSNGTATVVGYSGPGGVVSIPAIIGGLPVTCFVYGAVSDLNSLTGVIISNGVQMISSEAFFACPELATVTIPNSVAYIGASAFMSCTSLTNICIPGSVKVIADSAFAGCTNLVNVTLAEGINQIGGDAPGMFGTFAWCYGLTRVVIPDSVTNIVNGPASRGGPIGAFADCTGLTNVVVGKGLQFLGSGTFRFCSNLVGVYFRGDAPIPGYLWFGDFIFQSADQATVYYLPGTAGWTSTYAGRPTALWNPQMLTGNGNFGVQQGRFGFNIAGTPGIPIVVEASVNPAAGSWSSVHECTVTNGLIYFSDPGSADHSGCIYRIRSP